MTVTCPTCGSTVTLTRPQLKTAAKIGHWCDGPGFGRRHTIARMTTKGAA